MLQTTPAAPGRMKEPRHFLTHVAPWIQAYLAGRAVRARSHRHAERPVFRRPLPQVFLKRQRVCLRLGHGREAALFFAQFVQQLCKLAPAPVQRQGRLLCLFASKAGQHHVLPGFFREAQHVRSALFTQHKAGRPFVLSEQGRALLRRQRPCADGPNGTDGAGGVGGERRERGASRATGEKSRIGVSRRIPGRGQAVRELTAQELAARELIVREPPACAIHRDLCRFRQCRAVTEHVAAASPQIFHQGPLLRLFQAGQGAPQGRSEHGPCAPVLQGLGQSVRAGPVGGILFRRFVFGQKMQGRPFPQVQQKPGEPGRVSIRTFAALIRHEPAVAPGQQQPDLPIAKPRHAGRYATAGRIFAQAHDLGRRRFARSDAAGAQKAEGLLAGVPQAQLPLAAAAIPGERQKPRSRFLQFFNARPGKLWRQVFTKTAKKVCVHTYEKTRLRAGKLMPSVLKTNLRASRRRGAVQGRGVKNSAVPHNKPGPRPRNRRGPPGENGMAESGRRKNRPCLCDRACKTGFSKRAAAPTARFF